MEDYKAKRQLFLQLPLFDVTYVKICQIIAKIPGFSGRGRTILRVFCVVLIYWRSHGLVEPYNTGSFSAYSPLKKPPFCNRTEIIAYKRVPVDKMKRIFLKM